MRAKRTPMATAILVLATLVWCPVAFGLDRVQMRDGSIIYGEITQMTDGNLEIKTALAADETVTVRWAAVTQLRSESVHAFNLDDGSIFKGVAKETEEGSLQLHIGPHEDVVTIPLTAVTAINPPVEDPVTYRGNLTAGLSITQGNTKLRSGNLLGEFISRSEHQRLTIRGRYVYADQRGEVITRNSKGTIKLDFFLNHAFIFASAFFEQDTFQDLNLRTALSAGPGYQFIEKGDLTGRYLKHMELSGEAGLAWFNEDFKIQEDETSIRLRWGIDWNWPIIKNQVTFYHNHDAFPSLENTQDFYITTDQGLRFNIADPFTLTTQVIWRYNNNPPEGTKSTDTIYLVNLGFDFDTSK